MKGLVMLDVGKLATLRAVIEHGSFSAAAQALLLTQPAVSRQVALLERQAGTQLVHRSRAGVRPTEAGRLLAEHADAVLGRLALAEAQLAELAGLRRGHVRLGSFLTALVHLSAELATLLEARHPQLFRTEHPVIHDELVDRATAFSRLTSGELDVAIVFEHEFESDPPPEDIEVVDLFTDPPRLLLPAAHPLADAPTVAPRDLAGDTWVRAHHGSAARLVDHVLAGTDLRPSIMLAGHGDEPVESQAFVAAGHAVTVAHELNVLIHPRQIVSVAVTGNAPARRIQAAVLRGQRAPLPRAVLAVLEELGARRGTSSSRPSSPRPLGSRVGATVDEAQGVGVDDNRPVPGPTGGS